jgi:hypothetical protein
LSDGNRIFAFFLLIERERERQRDIKGKKINKFYIKKLKKNNNKKKNIKKI